MGIRFIHSTCTKAGEVKGQLLEAQSLQIKHVFNNYVNTKQYMLIYFPLEIMLRLSNNFITVIVECYECPKWTDIIIQFCDHISSPFQSTASLCLVKSQVTLNTITILWSQRLIFDRED